MSRRNNLIIKTLFRNLILLFLITTSLKVYSYSNFVGYGYTTCLTCHYNPLGNGPLNDYGRALGSNLISGKLFLPMSDEKLSENSGFLGSALNKTTFIRPSLDYRGLRYTTQVFKKDAKDSRFIHMQADANLVLRFMEDKFIFSGTYGIAPKVGRSELEYTGYSRELYLGVRVKDNQRLLLGKTDKAFGIRMPDHIIGGKQNTGLAENDQSFGATYHFFNERFDVGINYFIGDLMSVEAPLRQKGFSGVFEYSIGEKSRVGLSFMSSKSEAKKAMVTAAHFRAGFTKGMSFMGEVGINKYELTQVGSEFSDQYFYIQNMMRITRGLHLLTTFDYYKKNEVIQKQESQRLMTMFGLQYFPIPRIELRLDLSNIRNVGSRSDDSWSLLQQVHLWL